MKTGFFYSPDFLLHDNGAGHPESPARLRGIETVLRETGQWEKMVHPAFSPATEEDVALCHTPEHIARVKSISRSGGGELDGDTHINPHSFDVALLASGAAIEATKMVLSGELDNAFVAERPCGHHAESGRRPNSPWGFCLFNHAAIAARYAQKHLGIERVAILDFDVHHGNGTQEIFYEDPTVLFVSLHQSPLFPNMGETYERGEGLGVGATLNFPLPADSNGLVYRAIWSQIGVEVKKFAPQLIILSAGFDAHIGDPLAGMALTSDDFAHMVAATKSWANELCDGNLVLVLEGGYKLTALAESVAFSIQMLLND